MNRSLILFRILLVIIGSFIIYVGINVGFGGIPTLGFQVNSDFLTVTNEADFRIQDNHVRFLGGLFGTLGAFMVFAATHPTKYQQALRLTFVMMFIGGITRLAAPEPQVAISPAILTSFITEVVVMPIMFFWLPRLSDASDSTQ